jgi:hypothetical protein
MEGKAMCEYCNGKHLYKYGENDVVEINLDHKRIEIMVEGNWGDLTELYIDINYCPICGRNL